MGILQRLERRLGKFAIERLTLFIVGGMGIVFLLGYTKPEFVNALLLDLTKVRQGQVWRLVTYIFIPPEFSIWVLFVLYFFYLFGSNIENEWGAFKFNLYYLTGMIGTTVAAAIVGGAVGNLFLNASVVFAFATLFPDYTITLMFVLPVRMKWIALVVGGLMVWAAIAGSWATRAAIAAGLGNYLLFFSGHLWRLWKGRSLEVRQAAKRTSFAPPPVAGGIGHRACAICGAREEDGTDIRVCTCEKCGGAPRHLCLEHARNH